MRKESLLFRNGEGSERLKEVTRSESMRHRNGEEYSRQRVPKAKLVINLVRRCRLKSSFSLGGEGPKAVLLSPEEVGLLVIEATIGVTTWVERGNSSEKYIALKCIFKSIDILRILATT